MAINTGLSYNYLFITWNKTMVLFLFEWSLTWLEKNPLAFDIFGAVVNRCLSLI